MAARKGYSFRRSVAKSTWAVSQIMAELLAAGFSAMASGYYVPPPGVPWQRGVDDGDLYFSAFPRLRWSKGPCWWRMEVKELSVVFSGPKDWPYKQMYVCRQAVWDKADPRPLGVITVSHDWEQVGIVWARDFAHWTLKDSVDSRRPDAETEVVYQSPLSLVRWATLADVPGVIQEELALDRQLTSRSWAVDYAFSGCSILARRRLPSPQAAAAPPVPDSSET